MKRYSFRLRNVLRVRRVQESVARSELAAANNEVQKAIAVVEERVGSYETALATHALGTTGVDGFMKQRYFNDLASKAVIAARVSQASMASEASIKRIAFTEAARSVKTLERLDERSHEDYKVEAQREADRELDDLVTRSFPRPLRTAI